MISPEMAIEIEKKYRLTLTERQRVEAELVEYQAVFLGEDLEENTIFGGEILRTIGAVIRIRKTADRPTLTFKRRAEGVSDVKRQIEYETEISDAGAVAEILHELGLRPRLIYEKRRR
ncbi:MAG: CYTH domain-containing protein, partial [Pyrinomonadaceae bacterium]